jgi:Uma2 family endonuclease
MPTLQSAGPVAADRRFVIHDVSWRLYETLLEQLGDHAPRMTYDRGDLELMSPSPSHESFKSRLGRLIETMTYELGIAIRSGGSTTFKRKDLQRGIEPDECYWIAHERDVRARKKIDLAKDPPPDLAIEIDISRSSLDRDSIYVALGVPEIWRFDGRRLRVYVRHASGRYRTSRSSAAFPFLPVQRLTSFLRLDPRRDENTQVREFVSWLRSQSFYRGPVE